MPLLRVCTHPILRRGLGACTFSQYTKLGPPKHVTKISDLSRGQVATVLELAHKMKADPPAYYDALPNETLLMLFEKPSLRTRVSLEVGMTELGGHAIAYMIGDSPLGKKETFGDTAACLSRFVAAVTARVNSRESITGLTAFSEIPIVNALDDWAHPMQILADMQTIEEKKGSLPGLRMAYLGDIRNNMTYDLMRGGALTGFTVAVAGPSGDGYDIEPSVLEECAALAAANGGAVEVCETAAEAVAGADIVYTDSWQSYGISQTPERIDKLMPFQVTAQMMAAAKPDAIFMNCLPAMRGEEQTAEVIDGPQSVVFDQAENRLHAQKALLYLLITRTL